MRNKIYRLVKRIKNKFKKNINPEYFNSGHYYSVIPSVNDIKNRFENKAYNMNELSDIEINYKNQLKVFEDFKPLLEDVPFYSMKKGKDIRLKTTHFRMMMLPFLIFL